MQKDNIRWLLVTVKLHNMTETMGSDNLGAVITADTSHLSLFRLIES